MKVLLFNYRDRPKNRKAHPPLNIERCLFVAFVIIFVALLAVQAALLVPALRSSMTIQDAMEGSPLGIEEYLYSEGTMEIRLLNGEPSPDLKVLVNGEERASFERNIVEITVIDGDVVEIDGSDAADWHEITIASVSGNIEKDCMGKQFQIGKSVQKIVKVKMTAQ